MVLILFKPDILAAPASEFKDWICQSYIQYQCQLRGCWYAELVVGLPWGAQVNLRQLDLEEGNILAMTGPLPDLDAWAMAVPQRVRLGVLTWRRVKEVSGRRFGFF